MSEYRNKTESVKFISVKFGLNEEDIEKLERQTNKSIDGLENVTVTRYYDGHYLVEYSEGFQEENIEEEEDEKVNIKLPQAIVNIMPKFVYYSNYGNLSSKIYLPR